MQASKEPLVANFFKDPEEGDEYSAVPIDYCFGS